MIKVLSSTFVSFILLLAVSGLSSCRLSDDVAQSNQFGISWIPQRSHLVSYWEMENNWNDSYGSNNGNIGSDTGITFTSDAKLGSSAAILSGPATPGAIYFDTPTNLPSTSGYTLTAWIKPTTAARGGIIGYGTYWSPDEVNAFRMGDADDELVNYWWDVDLSVHTGFSLLGAWHYVVATYDSTTKVRSIYVDAALIGSDTVAAAPNFSSDNFTIGRTFPDGNEFFDGSIDDVAIWNVALSASEIQAIYDLQSP